MYRNNTLHVPCSIINVDSPKRIELLKQGVPKQQRENILGRGSYGTVIKAVYKGKQVAVKIIDNLNREKMLTVQSESNIVGWHHENIIEILKIDSGPRQAVIIMERFPGQCLQHILEATKIPLFHIIRISMDIANGIRYCHERNLLHLDLKPNNVLVAIGNLNPSYARDYQCKLCDFGSSMLSTAEYQQTSTRGTIRYMAPELFKNEHPTFKADIYSLGITMWQLRSRKEPFSWINDNEAVAYKVVKENIRPDHRPITVTSYLNPNVSNFCLCEHYGSDRSDHSIGDRSSLTLKTGWNLSLPEKTPVKNDRIPFANVSQRMNASPILSTSKSPKSTDAILSPKSFSPQNNVILKVNGANKHIDELSRVFYNVHTENKKMFIQQYKKLYENCWNANVTERPDILDVYNNLTMLSKCFSRFMP